MFRIYKADRNFLHWQMLGAFHLVKISGISGSAVNGTRFVGSSHWKIPRKSGKSKKVGPFTRLEFPNEMSSSISVSRSLYQFQVYRRAPRRTGVYDQMEQLFTNRKFYFCSHRIFRVFFLNGKRPGFPAVSWSTIEVSFSRCDWLFPPSAREVSPGNRSNYKSTRERVDSKGLYGRWRLHLIGSWCCVFQTLQKEIV